MSHTYITLKKVYHPIFYANFETKKQVVPWHPLVWRPCIFSKFFGKILKCICDDEKQGKWIYYKQFSND